jgi:hypothetical protein
MKKDAYQTIPLADPNNLQNPVEKEVRFKQYTERLFLRKRGRCGHGPDSE